MTMERQTSHRHASCSADHALHALANRKCAKVTPKSCLKRNLSELSFPDLLLLSKKLHDPSITTFSLSVSLETQKIDMQRFSTMDPKTTDAVYALTRAVARAIQGWMQNVELGLCLWNRDLKVLTDSLGITKTLRQLSFANSALGDVRLQVLAGGLRYCLPLRTLNLSGCALTDASVTIITSIIKAKPWERRICRRQLLSDKLSARTRETFISTSWIAPIGGTIVKGQDFHLDPLPPDSVPLDGQRFRSGKQKLTSKHRMPRSGQEWRQNHILRGRWSPLPSPETAASRKAEADWQVSLRGTGSHPQSSRRGTVRTRAAMRTLGLSAIDLSVNAFTDFLAQELCPVLRMEPPIHALNLRGNQMTRVGAKPILDVMRELNILRLVDMRGNSDKNLLGVLEGGEHYTTFSSFQEPFWMDPEALDPPVKSHAILPKKTTPEKRRISPRPKIWEKQTKTSATCSLLATNRVKNRLGGPPPNLTRPPVNSPTKPYTPHPPCERSNSRMNTPRSAPEKSRKSNCHPPPIQEPPISRLNPNPSLPQQLGKRRLSSSNMEKTQTAMMIPTKIGPWSGWPERTSLQDQPDDNESNVSGNVREDPELSDVDGVIAQSPTCIDPPKEQLMMHGPRDLHPDVVVDDDLEDLTNNYPAPTFSKCCSGSERRRARSASMCRQGGYPRDHNWLRDSSSIMRPPLMSPRHDILSPGRKSMDMCNRQIVNKDIMHRPVIRTSGTVSPKLSRKLSPRHHVNRSQHQFGKGNSKLQEMEFEEWSFFVTKMTDTLLELRDGLDRLIGPARGDLALDARQSARKPHQEPNSLIGSGMLRRLESSCKAIDSHVSLLHERQEAGCTTEKTQDIVQVENAVPKAAEPTKDRPKDEGQQKDQDKLHADVLGKLRDKHHESKASSRPKLNSKFWNFGPPNTIQRHRLMHHTHPLSTIEGANFPP